MLLFNYPFYAGICGYIYNIESNMFVYFIFVFVFSFEARSLKHESDTSMALCLSSSI